jgi:hypothetical protein
MFTLPEQEFLSGAHGAFEKRSAGIPPLPQGMPEHMFQRALEVRAKILARSFTEFRSRRSEFRREIVNDLKNLADLF